ncbi:MAG TPA: hypothetical protein ENJ93_00760 [Chloroflexi bacterium]|nr:hypothetical protein [Chloroflexota bacterium]
MNERYMDNWWQKLADFLHTANLIPLVVLVSTFHYYQALRSHDPLFVALPIALFVDLLHFRTVRQAVKSGARMWQLTAVSTTLMAFGLQWIFYNQPGESEFLVWWQVILFASIVPVGLAIMAWHHQWQEQEIVTDWQALIAAAQQRAEKMQQEAAAEHERAEAMQKEAEAVRERAAAMQTQLTAAQTQASEVQSQLEQVQKRTAQMQARLDKMQTAHKAWQTLNREMQTLALFNAQLLTAKDAADQLGVHVTTIRRKAKQLNGVAGGN